MTLFSLLFSTLFWVYLNAKRECFDAGDYDLTSQSGYLQVNGTRFNLKGTSWFGFETSTYVVHGLWTHDYHWFIDFMANYSFNAIRIPFSVEMVKTNPIPNSIDSYQMNEDLVNLTSLQVMDKLVTALGDAGILVMLDMHSLQADGYMENGLWYNSAYPQSETEAAWQTMVARYKSFWNVVAMDVFNEPFDGTWGTGTASTDFNLWCETIGNKTLGDWGADWLIFCEGVAQSPPCADACFWGEDLQGQARKAVMLNTPHKVVYSPHCYGPSVATQKYFDDPDFPSNMPSIWNTHYGFIRGENDAATVVGEWGGMMSGKDQQWMDAFASYLVSHDIPDNFFWCLNSDSGDTGGLIDSWSTPDTARLNLCKQVQPNPTKVQKTGEQICFDF